MDKIRDNNQKGFKMSVDMELPRYKCHKEVWALKIKNIEPSCGDRPAQPNEETDGGLIITPCENGYAPFKVDNEYRLKHNPYIGGYYVQYTDGYKSFSPAKAFESGYTLISQ